MAFETYQFISYVIGIAIAIYLVISIIKLFRG
jgi:hypothetical protein